MRNKKNPHNKPKTKNRSGRSNDKSGQPSVNEQQVRVKGLAAIKRSSGHKTRSGSLSAHREAAELRGLGAINRVRKGEFKTLSAAARAEHTTVKSIRRMLPKALVLKPGKRISVKARDPYSKRVKIVTDQGPVVVTARGSRQRELAGRHRSVYMRVLGGKLPPSALEVFRGKKVGGRELISDPGQLFRLAKRGELDQLDVLYVSPESRS